MRFETGDEMSHRAKFAFITWIGSKVDPLRRDKVSTDKQFKEIFKSVFDYRFSSRDSLKPDLFPL